MHCFSILKICLKVLLNFDESQLIYAYKCLAYKWIKKCMIGGINKCMIKTKKNYEDV